MVIFWYIAAFFWACSVVSFGVHTHKRITDVKYSGNILWVAFTCLVCTVVSMVIYTTT